MKLVIANWKEYPATAEEAVLFARSCDIPGLVLCPPHEFLDEVSGVIRSAFLGAQDYAPDLFSRGVRYVIVGHSDRRAAGDTDSIVAEKTALAMDDDLIPIICVGETHAERAAGETDRVMRRQVIAALSVITAHAADFPISEICFAYEPVWSISTTPGAVPASVADALRGISVIQEVVLHAHCPFVVRYLYGGSVTEENAGDFLVSGDIHGLLVGGACRNAQSIKTICQQSQK